MYLLSEMFRLRGAYGPKCIQRLIEAVNAVPATGDPEKNLIDLENCLNSVVSEFGIIESLLIQLNDDVFGFHTVPNYVPATARNISEEVFGEREYNIAERDARVALSLDRIRNLIAQFVLNDPNRSGLVDQVAFRSIIVVAGQVILGFDCGRDAHKLVDVCLRKFKGDTPDSSICYADFWATLLAFLSFSQGGDNGLDGNEATKAVLTMERGVEQKQASAIVSLISYMQCPFRSDNTWTTRSPLDAQIANNNNRLATSGEWSTKMAKVPEDVPGVLTAKSFRIDHLAERENPTLEVKLYKQFAEPSVVPRTERMVLTLSGEITHPQASVPYAMSVGKKSSLMKPAVSKDKPTLRRSLLSLDSSVETLAPSNLMTRASYSRSMEKLVDARTAVDQQVNTNLSVNSDLDDDFGFRVPDLYDPPTFSDRQAEKSVLNDSETFRRPSVTGASLSQQHQLAQTQEGNIWISSQSLDAGRSTVSRLLAMEEVEIKRSRMLAEERELHQKLEAEQEIFNLRRKQLE